MNEEMTAQERNEAEIQLIEDPELDDRMNDIEKESMDLFWDKFWKIQDIYESHTIRDDQIDPVLDSICDMELFISQYHPKAVENCMFMITLHNGHVYSNVSIELAKYKKVLMELKKKIEAGTAIPIRR